MSVIRSLCVYCGSSTGRDPRHRETAEHLGRAMVDHDIELVFGGGNVGLMGVVAGAVMAAGGRATGVMPRFLLEREAGDRAITRLLEVDSMHERKQRMFEMSDGFLVLPGGLGTLDETIEVLTWRQLGLHDKPIVVLNDGGCWDPLIQLVDSVIRGGFAGPEVTALFTAVDSVDEVFSALAAARVPRVAPCAPERL